MQVLTRASMLATLALAASGTAQAASYFVQPIVGVGIGGLINGLEIDGALERQEGFNNAPTSINSSVNLADGTIKGNVALTGSSPGLGFAQGRFGERVTFENGVGTSAEFSFSFDGYVIADARDPNLNSLLQIQVEAYVAIFDVSAGANASNWYDLSFGGNDQTLFKDRMVFNFSNPEEDLYEYVYGTLWTPLEILDNRRSFDVFANLTVLASLNNNPGSVDLDFLNTGRFGIWTEPGVTYTSQSGVFLDSTGVTVVPLPASAWLLLSGLGSIAALRTRRRAG
jgi:hypothetical protein